ncbi:MAG: hypothetical protein FWB98_06540 [Defluviitaleaceae bacterium]|nr:hypothetical protein [Defluviitaleaceae bacterium]
MELTLEIKEMANHLAEHLDDRDKFLMLGIMRKFMPDDVATDEDLRNIDMAMEELARGETTCHNDIDWD